MGAIRQMRYCTGNVKFVGDQNGNTKTVDVTLSMPALDSNKVLVLPFFNKDLHQEFVGGSTGKSYFQSITKINDGVRLTYYSNATNVAFTVNHTFTYEFYLIEFY